MDNLNLYQDKLDNYKPKQPCLKQIVKALIVTPSGMEIFGSNDINTCVDVCPRVEQGCKTGEGYSLCKDVCNQNSHAEVTAIKNSKGIDIERSILYLTGHSYCCDDCIREMKKAKISKAIVLDSGKVYKL